eukprot:TRINITY_DN6697_c0_g2_i1.p1 TRINITY_DN6697_c0_g2~~TRINITY_DN6697_c0_g2_i1.p1  ORF type:complete len:231 (-),score=41.80 TRINITY_DN6697_c0_g2_i1:96-788(-)
MPSHPIAHKLIELSNLPIAAPSANLSGRPSPTTADHVLEDMQNRIKCIIDGGSCSIGLESTVIDVFRDPPLILRPGGVTLEQLQQYLPTIEVYQSDKHGDMIEKPATPGLKYRHYSPKAPVFLLKGSPHSMESYLEKLFKEQHNSKVGLVHTHLKTVHLPSTILSSNNWKVYNLGDEDNPAAVAHGLFVALRVLDKVGVDKIVIEAIEEKNEGLAVMNRIKKAATEIIYV